MRIKNVKVLSKYKNLKDFTIDFDSTELNLTVLLGENSIGKTNFFEVLISIFETLERESKPPFEYEIEYECNNYNISIKLFNNRYTFHINSNKLRTYNEFFSQKDQYLPYVISYYSGNSNRIKELFKDTIKEHYKDAYKKDTLETRKSLYLEPLHSMFILFSYIAFKDQQNSFKKYYDFLEKYLNNVKFKSTTIILHEPYWKLSAIGNDETFWKAHGAINTFLHSLKSQAFSPFKSRDEIWVNLHSKSQKEIYTLNIREQEHLYNVVSEYDHPFKIFELLDTTYMADLLYTIEINIKKRSITDDFEMSNLSEGELQLLSIIGILNYNIRKETLILLDEPDTHLNPIWKKDYFDILKEYTNVGSNTQLIINTHDPVLISSLEKDQVRILEKDQNNKVNAIIPTLNPRGAGVSGILTSKMFGLEAALDNYTLKKLEDKRRLVLKEEPLSDEERELLSQYNEELESYGFGFEMRDPLFMAYVKDNFGNKGR